MAYCVHCGEKLPEKAKFCPSCGKSVEDVGTKPVSLEKKTTVSPVPNEPEKGTPHAEPGEQESATRSTGSEKPDDSTSAKQKMSGSRPIVTTALAIVVGAILLIFIGGIIWVNRDSSYKSTQKAPATSIASSQTTPKPTAQAGTSTKRVVDPEEMAQTFASYMSELSGYSDKWSVFLNDNDYTQEKASAYADEFTSIAARVEEMRMDAESMVAAPRLAEWQQITLQILTDTQTAMEIIGNMDADNNGNYSLTEFNNAKTDSKEYIPIIQENVNLFSEEARNITEEVAQNGKKETITSIFEDEANSTATPKPTATPTAKPTTKPTAKPTMKPTAKPRNTGIHTDAEAFTIATYVVKEKLKAPSTAKFCKVYEATITYLGDNQYEVKGWVDAENSFGAMIRQKFTVTYTAVKQGSDVGCTGARCTFSD